MYFFFYQINCKCKYNKWNVFKTWQHVKCIEVRYLIYFGISNASVVIYMLLTKDLKNATHNKYLCYKVFQLYHWQTKIKHVWDSTCNKNWLYSLKIYLYTNVRVPRINCISVLFNQTMKSIYIQTITSLQENFVISSAYIFDLQASLHIFNFLA